jgi:hypothetical protein
MRWRYFLPGLGKVEPKYGKKIKVFSYLRSGMKIPAI